MEEKHLEELQGLLEEHKFPKLYEDCNRQFTVRWTSRYGVKLIPFELVEARVLGDTDSHSRSFRAVHITGLCRFARNNRYVYLSYNFVQNEWGYKDSNTPSWIEEEAWSLSGVFWN